MTKRIPASSISPELRIKDVPRAKRLPKKFKIGREAQIQIAKAQKRLFDDIQEVEQAVPKITDGITNQISKVDFSAFRIAIGQILSNQSYIYGNEDTHSGMTKDVAVTTSSDLGEEVYVGTISTTLTEICSKGYGEKNPTSKQRKAMKALIDTLDVVPAEITFPNGRIVRRWLCKKLSEDIEGKFKNGFSGEVEYVLSLNPIFTYNVKRNYAEFDQDTMYRLTSVTKKKTEAHYTLINLIAAHNKTTPYTRTLAYLLEMFGIEEEVYKNQRKRTETQLIALFDDMVNAGFAKDYKIDYVTIKGREVMNKITFTFNEKKNKKGNKKAEG